MGNQQFYEGAETFRERKELREGIQQMGIEFLLTDDDEFLDPLWENLKDKLDLEPLDDYENGVNLPNNYHTNKSGDDGDELFNVERLLSGINSRSMSGFKTPESHIQDLQEPAHMKFFTVLSNEGNLSELRNLQEKKAKILYALYLLKGRGEKETFQEYFTSVLKDAIDSRAEGKDIQGGFGFIMFILQEMKGMGDVVEHSMEKVIESLKQYEAGEDPNYKEAFTFDAGLNNARSFLIDIINGKDVKLASLAYRILFMIGLTRCRVEDMLLICNLLSNETREEIDIRPVIDKLKRYYENQAEKAEEIINKEQEEKDNNEFDPTIVDVQSEVKMKLCSQGSNTYTCDALEDCWECDGDFFYVTAESGGLSKISTASHGRMAGRVLSMNKEFEKEDLSIMLFGGKLYIRNKQIAPEPFVVLDKNTLKEIEMDPDQDFEPKKGDIHSIQWNELDEDSGRSLTYTPMFSDGKYVYVIARYFETKEEKEARDGEGEAPPPYLVCEAYDPQKNFEFVRKVTLFTKPEVKYLKEQNSIDWLKKSKWATNGTHLILFKNKNRIKFFNLETGLKIKKMRYEMEKDAYSYTYDMKRGIFYYLFSYNNELAYKMFKFDKFKFNKYQEEQQNAEISQNEEIEDDNETKDQSEQYIFGTLIKQMTTAYVDSDYEVDDQLDVLKNKEASKLAVAMINRLFIVKNILFQDKYKKVSSKRNKESVMEIFRYPFVTHLTQTTFKTLTKSLNDQFKHLNEEQKLKDLDFQFFISTLKIMRANLQALKYCQVNLVNLLTDKVEEQNFRSLFTSGCIYKYSQGTGAEQFKAKSDEHKEFWVNIHHVCKSIQKSYADAPENILSILNSKLDQVIIDGCQSMISQIAKKSQIKQLMTSEDCVSNVENLTEIFIKLCQMSSNLLKSYLEQIRLVENVAEFFSNSSADFKLILICEEFLVNFAEEVNYQYSLKSDDLRIKQKTILDDQEAIIKSDPMMMKLGQALSLISGVVFFELSQYYSIIMDELEDSCKNKTKKRHFEGYDEQYQQYEKVVCSVMLSHISLQQIAQLNLMTHYMCKNPDFTWTLKLLQGSEQFLLELNRFYVFQKKYGDKIDSLGSEIEQMETTSYDFTLNNLVGKLHKNVSWYFGSMAYILIKKEPMKEPEAVNESLPNKIKKRLAAERHRAQLLQNISKSNLLSGGLDPKYFSCFSTKTKQELQAIAELLEDHTMLKYLNQEETENVDETNILEAVAFEGKNQDTEKLIKALHTIQMQGLRIEGAPVTLRADMGGAQVQRADGMKLTRYAFSIMLKFSDLTDDFQAMQNAVILADSPQDQKQQIAYAVSAEEILNCWKSASQMRRWLQEKKSKRSDKLTTRLMNAAKQKKKFKVVMRERTLKTLFKVKKSYQAKKEQEEKNKGDQNQIDSSTKPQDGANKENQDGKKDGEEKKKAEQSEEEEIDESKYALTEAEKEEINDQAFNKTLEHTQLIIEKIGDKTAFLIKLNIPLKFKKQDPTLMKNGITKLIMIKAPSTLREEEKKDVQELDWITKLKNWKKNQTQDGAITSLTEQKKEIWDSGLTAVKALLQTSVEADKIQENVEQIYINASQRCAGMKLIHNILKSDMPFQQFENLIMWFTSAFRHNENKLCHYLDDLSGQGIHFENLSSKYFFEIISFLVERLKNSEYNSEIKILLNSLKWNFKANDHQELLKLGIYNILHKGTNDQDNLLKKSWGRSLQITSLQIDEQEIQNDVIDSFEELFLTVTSRIVQKEVNNSSNGDQNGTLPNLEKATSIIDADTSGILLGQAFDIIFKEFERYIDIMMRYEGIDWDVFVRKRNEDRHEHGADLPLISNDENVLMDEVEESNFHNNDDDTYAEEEGREEKEELRQKIITTTKLIENSQFRRLSQLYSDNFLMRLLKLVELFTCIAQSNAFTLSIVQKIANPYHMSKLMNLLFLCSPKLKIIILKIIQHIIQMKTPSKVFEEAVNNLKRDPDSMTSKILNKIHPKIGFENSLFLQLLYKYLLYMRSKMWITKDTGSDYQYAVSLSLTNLLRTINAFEDSDWSVQIKDSITQALKMIEVIPVQEIDAFMSLLPGGEYGGMTSGQPAITNNNETVIVLGYSSNWKQIKDFKDEDSDEYKKLLCQLHITPAFINQEQQVIALYYNEQQKDKQELMSLSPSKLSPISYLSNKDGLKIAQNSPLLDINIVKALIGILKAETKEDSGMSKAQISANQFKQCSVLKILCQQIKDLGEDYINFLEKEGVLAELIQYLFHDDKITLSDNDQKNLVMPLKWLEAKIQRIRKFAIESMNSLNFQEKQDGTSVFILDEKQILLNRTSTKHNSVFSTNIFVSAAFNFYKVENNAEFDCVHANELNVVENSILKNGMVIMDYNELNKLEDRTLSILNNSEAIITNLPKEDGNIDELFKRIVDIFHEDTRKSKMKSKGYKNILETVVIFIPDESFAEFTKPLEDLQKDTIQIDSQSETVIKGPVGRLLSEIKQLTGIDEEEAIYNLDPNNLDDISKVISSVHDSIIEKQNQEQEYRNALNKAKDANDEEAVKKIEEAEIERLNKRKEVIAEKKNAIIEASQNLDSSDKNNEFEFINIPDLAHFDDFSTQPEWWEELENIVDKNLKEKISASQNETDEEKKTDQQMTQMLWQLMNSFNKKDLEAEHSRTINLLIYMQRKSCIIDIFKLTKIEKMLSLLVQSQNDQKKFAKFMKLQFNSAVIKKLKIGQNTDYQSMKSIMRNVFDHCNENAQMNQFIKYFLVQEVILPAIAYSKERNNKSIVDYFQVEDKALKAVNPYLMIFVTKYLIKKDAIVLKECRHGLSNLFNLHLLFALKFQDNKKLASKHLKCAVRLIIYSKKHLKELAEAGEMNAIIQNKLVGLTAKTMEVAKDSEYKLQQQQQMWLELHLMINDVWQRINDEHGIIIEKTIENSTQIQKIMGDKQTLIDGEQFDFLLYLYHLKSCPDSLKEPMSQIMSSNRPSFDVTGRGFVSIPEFEQIQIKIRETTKLQAFSEFGVSHEPDGEVTYYSYTDKPILWPHNKLHLAYPNKKQKILAFGQNTDYQLGAEDYDGFFKQAKVCKLEKDNIPENFKPVKLYIGTKYSCAIGEDGKLVETGYLEYVGTKDYFQKDNTLTEEVVMASISNYNMWVLLKDNSLWFKGYSVSSVLPHNSDYTDFTKLQQWWTSDNEEEDKDDKIVEVTAGYQIMFFVTEKGHLWARGEEIISKIGGSGQSGSAKLNLPENKLARRVWCNKEDDGQCCFVLLEDKETGKKVVHSAGYQSYGLLGLGKKKDDDDEEEVGIKDSSSFQPLDFDQEDNYFVEIALRTWGAIAIDTKGKLWGWGDNSSLNLGFFEKYTDDENYLYSPKEIGPLNDLNLKPKKIEMNNDHSLILFEDEDGKDHLYSIGFREYTYLGMTEMEYVDSGTQEKKPFRELTQFADAKILDFGCSQEGSLILIEGDSSDLAENLFTHELSDGTKCKGLLHFYKKENDMFFIPQNEYEERKDELPELSLAIKCPIEGIQEKDWPDLAAIAADALDLAAAEPISHIQKDFTTGEPIQGPLYHTRYKLNDKNIEVNHSETEVVKDDINSINPIIYYRLAKPLKNGKELPQFELTNYYKTNPPYQFDFQFIPDMSKSKNQQFLDITKDLWSELQEIVNKKIDPDVKKEILEILDRFLKTKLDEEDLDSIDINDIIKLEQVNYKNTELKEMPEKQIRLYLNLYWGLNVHMNDLLYYQTSILKNEENTNANIIQRNMSNLLTSLKTKLVQKEIEKLPTGGSGSTHINRMRAGKFKESGKVDHEGKKTIFGQLYQQCLKNTELFEHFKQNNSEERFWSVTFVGEGSQDAGGPFREMLTNVALEIQSTSLPLMIKTVNNKSEWGFSRECWTLNPDANSPTHKELFKFMGRFVGYSIRSGSAMDWHFTPILWKQIKGEKVIMKDFDSFDTYALSAWNQMSTLASQFTADDFNAGIDETFTTILSNTKQVPICPGGEDKQVTYDNYKQYVELSMQARLNEAENQLKWLKEGVNEVINLDILAMLNWSEVEQRACGGEIETEALKQITDYSGCSEESKVIKWFWKMFDSFDQVNRKNYLKFAWGRSKLPVDLSNCDHHKLEFFEDRDPLSFPKSHTCFFTTDVPNYNDYDVMVKRVSYAIQTCDAIDDDGDPNRDYGDESD